MRIIDEGNVDTKHSETLEMTQPESIECVKVVSKCPSLF